MVRAGRKPELKVDEVPALEELNLVEFPLAVLSDYVPDGRKTLEFHDEIRDKGSDERINRVVTITGADKWGLPNWQDQDVLLAMMVLTKRKNGFKDRRVRFTLHELRAILRWPHNGPYNKRLQESLDRWTGVTIKYSHWRSKGSWKKAKAFHVIEWYALSMGRDFDPDEPQTFTWNELVFESFQANNTKALDWEFYIGLNTPTSKRLFRFLDKRFWLKSNWSFDLAEFSENKLGLNKVTEIWRYKERLAPALKELEKKGFLRPCSDKNRYAKVRKGKYDITFERARGGPQNPRLAPGPGKAPSKLTANDAGENPTVQLLWARGVTNAVELVGKFSVEAIERQVENFDDRLKHGEKLSAGWLRRAIEAKDGFGFRKGFISKEQREAEERAKAERHRLRVEEEKARLAKEKRDELEFQRIRKEVDDYLKKFSLEEQDALFEKALSSVAKFTRDMYKNSKRFNLSNMVSTARFTVLREYLSKEGLLDD